MPTLQMVRSQGRPFSYLGGLLLLSDFPPHVQTTVQRILDAEARRLLAEQADRDALSTTARGCDDGAPDRGSNQLAAAG